MEGRVASALTPLEFENLAAHHAADDRQLVVGVGIRHRHFRSRYGICGVGQCRRPLQHRGQSFKLCAFESTTSEPILCYAIASSRLPHLTPEVGHLRHRQAALLRHHNKLGRLERLVQRGDQLLLFRSVH